MGSRVEYEPPIKKKRGATESRGLKGGGSFVNDLSLEDIFFGGDWRGGCVCACV